MKPFAYVTAQTPPSAVALAGRDGRFIAGGIDLLGEMKEHLAEPARLVNIKALPDTMAITPGAARWTVGANVKLAVLAAHPELRAVLPALAEAADEVGSPQMRNVATVGGNLAQHSRCWYYRHRDVECLKKGGPRCFAREGQNKYHALFTGSPCLSPCVSNLAVALTALEAGVEVQRGRRVVTLPLADLYRAAWDNPRAHHGLQPGDLILRVHVPVAVGGRSVYLQSSEKSAFDWALVSCAASARVDGLVLRGVRIVLGAVAPVPWRVAEAEKLLEGRRLSDALATQAADRILRDAMPRAGNAYKVPLAHALIRRALVRVVAEG
jgi:xanthine dehydrogenase YagS FAD-binding subunit